MASGARVARVQGQPSWKIQSSDVEAYVTKTGGHLAPVIFDRKKSKIQPYHIAPWANEKTNPKLPPLIRILRGDFFCMPFGGNTRPYHGEHHPIHGETANGDWKFEKLKSRAGRTLLHLSLKTKVRKGRVDKRILLLDGHNAVYSQHVVSSMSGPMNPGHHAMLRFPAEAFSGIVSTSRFVYGQVYPGHFERPDAGGYSMLKRGGEFLSLDNVPTIAGAPANLSRYPARAGFEDLVIVVSALNMPFAWTAVTFPKQRFVWFAMKDPRLLRETVFWFSNGGRHYPPWNGRHVNVLGIEDVTSYFNEGLAESSESNALAAKGFATHLRLSTRRPLVINYIMAVAQIPAGFDRVANIESTPEGVALKSSSGKVVPVALDTDFLFSGALHD